MKNGAPIMLIKAPTGNSPNPSCMEKYLTIISEKHRRDPPMRADDGIRTLWSLPTISLEMWGITNPMNPMIPETATAAPVRNDVTIIEIYLNILGL